MIRQWCHSIIVYVPLVCVNAGVSAQTECLPSPVFSGNVVLIRPSAPPTMPLSLQTASMATGDFDNDGRTDLMHGSYLGTLLYYRGGGDEWWDFHAPVVINLPFAVPTPNLPRPINAMAVGDFNEDGDDDLVVANYHPDAQPATQRIHVLCGNGDGTFQPGIAWGPNITGVVDLAVADFNGDSNLDVLATLFQDSVIGPTIMWGTGSGTSSGSAVTASHRHPIGLAVADVDQDGDVDFTVGHERNLALDAALFRNNGNGAFVEEPLPLQKGFGHRFGDVNGDSWPDLVIGSGQFVPISPNGWVAGSGDEAFYVSLNDQSGNLLPAIRYAITSQPSQLVAGTAPFLADLDGDLRPEVVIGRTNVSCSATQHGDTLLTFQNAGDGSYSAAPALSHYAGVANFRTTLFASDLNVDGMQDLVAHSTNRTTILLNNGFGGFLGAQGKRMGLTVSGGMCQFHGTYTDFKFSAVGDMNNDGRFDIVAIREEPVGPAPVLEVAVMLQNAQGDFTTVVSTPFPEQWTQGIVLADFDQDENLDIALATMIDDFPPVSTGGKRVRIALGNGDGSFAPWVLYQTVGYTPRDIAAADVDGDSYPDLLVPTRYGPNQPLNQSEAGVSVFLNNGDGTMASPIQYNTGEDNLAVAIADLNGDAHLDIGTSFVRYITAGVPSTNGAKILLNNGAGAFTLASTALLRPEIDQAAVAWKIAFQDVNGDERPDLFVTMNWVEHEPTSGGTSVLLNNGRGTFQQASDLDVGTLFGRPFFADFNSDGDVDIAQTLSGEGLHAGVLAVRMGNGDGTFGPRVAYAGIARAPFAHDFNGDGAVDIGSVLGASPDADDNTHAGFSILLNRMCQAPDPCPADIDDSGAVNIDDLLEVLNAWGPCTTPPCPADIDSSGAIDIDDLLEVLNNWGPCP